MSNASDLEALTHDYGKEIFARLDRGGPLPFSPHWFDERLMEWSMGDPDIKLQLFRFVDALPLLRGPAAITRHLREYFAEAQTLPGWMKFGLRVLPTGGLLGNLFARASFASASRLARRFIAGTNVEEALDAIAAMRRRSLAFTVDLLGEATITEAEADKVQAEYFELLRGLSREVNVLPEIPLIDRDHLGAIPRVNVSVKLSALYSQFDPIDPDGTSRAVRAKLRPILRAARQSWAFVNFDMEQYSFKDTTIRIFKEILDEDEFRDWADVGIAVQAYLRDCGDDLKDLAAWAEKRGVGVWVRLVKGAYWDYETVVSAQNHWPVPVFTRKWQSDHNYEELTHFLMERYQVVRPALGSHNVRSLAHGLATADKLNLPKGSYEIQMLYGMAEPMKDAFVSLGQRVRVYTPYGQLLPGMAYLVRRLLENTSNESFLRASFKENVPEEQLLMNPSSKAAASNGRPPARSPGQGGFQNEPFTDFSREAARQAMSTALAQVRDQLGRTYPLVINNEAISTDGAVESVNPSHGKQVVGRAARATVAHAERAVAAAKSAFPSWRDMEVKQRADFFFRAADEMRRRKFELAAWMVLECAKQWREADADVAEAIDFCDFYAHEMIRLDEPRHRDVPGEENVYFYEPRGVAVVIAPWNFPLAILAGMTAAAAASGNTVVMKPAEQSVVTAGKFMEVLQTVGLPAGVINYLPGVGEEIGPTLANHPDVSLIAFTGSRNVGLMLNRQGAEVAPGQTHVKRVIAEMGGKNAVIVDDDADLDEAVLGVAHSAFGYQGQKCSACSRVLVLENVYDAFVPRLIEATKSLTVGPADDPGFFVGAVIDADARQRILQAIERGKQEAKLAHAGDLGALADEGFFVAPHVFVDVPPGSSLAQEEIFGPVLAVIKVRDLTHALEVANGTQYALTGGFYSRSPGNIKRVRREFRVGNLYVNRKITGALVDRQPFGGFKLSGIGSKAGGPDYLLQFLLPRVITENTMRRGFAPEADSPQGGP